MSAALDLLSLDEAARAQAIDPARSVIVEAPAGAGKTELLTQRFLALLATVDEPEEVVALTFTRKAAAEMLQRVSDGLRLAQGGQPPTQPHKRITYDLALDVLRHDHARQWGLLQQSSRLHITTLDALCARLARQMPLLSRLGATPALADDATPLFEEAALLTLQALDEEAPDAPDIAHVLRHFDNDSGRLQSLLVAMLRQRDQWLGHSLKDFDVAGAEHALSALLTQALRALATLWTPDVQTPLMAAGRWAAHTLRSKQLSGEPGWDEHPLLALLDWSQALPGELTALPQWRALAELLLTAEGKWRNGPPTKVGLTKSEGGPEGKALGDALKTWLKDAAQAPQGEAWREALAAARGWPDPGYATSDVQLLQALMRVLRGAAARLWLVFQQRGQIDHIQMAQQALQALGPEDAPSDLQLQLDHRIRHLLVDEFQDTSPTQVQLLRKLTAGWTGQDGRSLFLVGDPMQSIYRFRQADVGLFIRVRDGGIGPLPLQALRLYRNNRSTPEVVSWVNRVFPTLFAEDDDFRLGAVQFAPAQATREAEPGTGVHWHPVWLDRGQAQGDTETDAAPDALGEDPAGEDVDQPVGAADETPASPNETRLEAQAVLSLIQQARQRDPQASIAVLVRARSHLVGLVTALRQSGQVPFQAVEIEALAEQQIIQDLISLTRALHHAADRTHWLALLRGPWCGLLLADLHALAADDHEATIWTLMNQPERLAQLSPDGQARLTHVREVLQQAFSHPHRQRLRRWVQGVWLALGGPYALRPGQAEQDLSAAEAFFEVLDQLDAANLGGALNLEALERAVADLYAPVPPLAGTPVQLMTMHKAKGLEFDEVILPSLHRNSGRNDPPLVRWEAVLDDDGQEHLLAAANPGKRSKAQKKRPSVFDYLGRIDRVRSQHELRRLLYVAATRAKRRLHLVGVFQPQSEDATQLKPPSSGAMAALLWPACSDELHQRWQQHRATEPATPASALPLLDPSQFAHRLVRLNHVGWPAPLQDLPPASPPPSGTAARASSGGITSELTHAEAPAPAPAAAEGESVPSFDVVPSLSVVASRQLSWPSDLAADLGTLVHRVLEGWARRLAQDCGTLGADFSVGAAQSLAELPRHLPAWTHWFQARGHDPATAQQAALETQRHIANTLGCERGRWLLQPHPQARSEWALLTPHQGRAKKQVMDRSFVADGQRWIIDLKTTPATPEAAARAHYPQLARYRALFSPSTPIRLALFLTDSGTWVAW